MLGKIWLVRLYSVISDRVEEHDVVSQKLLNYYQQISPEKEFYMFRQRFHAPNGRVAVIDGFDSISDWETWLDKCHQDDEYRQIAREWYPTIDQDTFRAIFWEKRMFE